ncbi:conserved hypothetical protein [Streptomyces sp. SPB78]|nr:conserved hypothetical protein [Streptomyces sp. SPB78]
MAEADPPEVMIDKLKARADARAAKSKVYDDLYNGDENKLFYATPEFSQQTGGLFDEFSDNWCATVPDAVRERLVVTAFQDENGQLDTVAWKAWRRTGAHVDVGLALLDALVVGRSHAMVWNPTGSASDITFLPNGQAAVDYVPGARRRRRAAVNVWSDGFYDYATLFVRAQGGRPAMVYRRQRVSGGGTWAPRTEGLRRSELADFANPMGDEVPIVELPNRARLHGDPVSDIKTVAPLQRTVNTQWAHLLTNSDFLALPQRVVLGMDKPVKDLIDPASGDIIGEEDIPLDLYSRDRLLWLSKAGAGIAQFNGADLGNYLRVIEALVRHIAAQTRTPPHYLLGEMSNIAAEALTAAESGLVAKASDKQLFFGADLLEIMRLEALAAGEPERAAALALGRVLWRDPQYRSEALYADALTKYKAIGVPDEALWRMIPGVEPEQVEEWKRLRDEQNAAAARAASSALAAFGPKEPGDDEDEEDLEDEAA